MRQPGDFSVLKSVYDSDTLVNQVEVFYEDPYYCPPPVNSSVQKIIYGAAIGGVLLIVVVIIAFLIRHCVILKRQLQQENKARGMKKPSRRPSHDTAVQFNIAAEYSVQMSQMSHKK